MFGIREKISRHYGKVKELPGKASQQVEETFELIKLVTIRLVIIALTASILIFLAIFLYGLFYFTFVPSPEHEGKVFLQFEPCLDAPGICGFLNGSLQLSPRNHILMAGQPYTVSVQLHMPESPANRNSGMFMTCAQLKTRESQVIRHNCKSAILQYRSDLLRVIDTFVFLPGLLTGHSSEKQVVEIEFFDDFYDDPLGPAVLLDLQVKSRFVEIYTTTYRIHANFSGLRYAMFYFPITSAVIGSLLNLVLLSTLFFLSWYRFFMTRDEVVETAHEGLNGFTDPFLEDVKRTEEVEADKKSHLEKFLDKEEEKVISGKPKTEE